MDQQQVNNICQFIGSLPRNRLIIHKSLSLNGSIDIGYLVASYYHSREFDVHAAHLEDWLEGKIVKQNASDEQIGDYISIKNLGILMEHELKFDFVHFINKLSRNNLLFVQWEGEIEDKKLYFLTKSNGIQIDISELSVLIFNS